MRPPGGHFSSFSSFPGTAPRVKRKIVPLPGLGSLRSCPPCASTIERQIESPIPMPFCLVEKKARTSG